MSDIEKTIEQTIADKIIESESFSKYFFFESANSVADKESWVREFIVDELIITYPEIKGLEFDLDVFMKIICNQYLKDFVPEPPKPSISESDEELEKTILHTTELIKDINKQLE